MLTFAPMLEMKRIKALKELLNGEVAIKIVILSHHKPDGDAIGSGLALYNYLRKKEHEVAFIVPNDFGSNLDYLKGVESIIDFEKDPTLAETLITHAELVFCLDFNSLKRINELGPIVEKCWARKVLIDHHLFPENFDDFRFIDQTASSTAEMVYRFIEHMGDITLIDAEIGACIYTGIMTDTGSFRFKATTPLVHRIVAHLLELGTNHVEIHESFFDRESFSKLKFVGHVLQNKLTYLPEYKTAYIAISAQELEEYNIQTGETEGLVNYALRLDGVMFAALIIDRTQLVKLSFRSKGDVSANAFATTYFNGGGHFNAAGGQSSTSLEATIEAFLANLASFKDHILKPS